MCPHALVSAMHTTTVSATPRDMHTPYPCPPHLLQFMEQFLTSAVRTEDPSEANLFFVPAFTFHYSGACFLSGLPGRALQSREGMHRAMCELRACSILASLPTCMSVSLPMHELNACINTPARLHARCPACAGNVGHASEHLHLLLDHIKHQFPY